MFSRPFPNFSCRKHANPSQNASRRQAPVNYYVVRQGTVTFFATKALSNAAVQVAANWSLPANALTSSVVYLSHKAKS
ncbi:MAG: hypothetical protein ACI9ZV_000771 [Candidatus Azotimanducaceae bacterium]|jgi:hypothetical protein